MTYDLSINPPKLMICYEVPMRFRVGQIGMFLNKSYPAQTFVGVRNAATFHIVKPTLEVGIFKQSFVWGSFDFSAHDLPGVLNLISKLWMLT